MHSRKVRGEKKTKKKIEKREERGGCAVAVSTSAMSSEKEGTMVGEEEK